MRQIDVVALTVGLLLTGFAVASLWLAFGQTIDWQRARVIAPLAMVLIGVLGLALSRRN